MFPEIEAATEALKARIGLTEAEIAEMKERISSKKELLRSWRKALDAFGPKRNAPKKSAQLGRRRRPWTIRPCSRSLPAGLIGMKGNSRPVFLAWLSLPTLNTSAVSIER
jgi:hypothetical protein